MTAPTLEVDGLVFDVRRSARRRTMAITVERDGTLGLSAPPQVADEQLRAYARRKLFWIHTKLAQKERLQRAVPLKSFVDGEGFLYLGRSHRLRLVDDQDVALKLVNGRFRLRRADVPQGREHFIGWYTARACHWLAQRVTRHAVDMDVTPAGVRVQDLGYRWGSCGKGQWLYFHWKTILLPPLMADYVVVHEMAHLHEPNHGPAFWQRVERAMPDYARRKEWVAEHGMEVEGL